MKQMLEQDCEGLIMDAGKATRGLPGWFVKIAVGRRPTRTLVRLAVLIIGTWILFSFVLTPPIRVEGISMYPTFHNGQINFLNRLAFVNHDPQRGDIVGVRPKGVEGNGVLYLKRIVALPGETIAFQNGKLLINDQPLDEPYVGNCDWNMPPLKLGFDEYYVVGDNRSMAIEDHTKFAARRQQIVGRILFKPSRE
jgi:signal peptidase I